MNKSTTGVEILAAIPIYLPYTYAAISPNKIVC